MDLNIKSEINDLRCVITHKPGIEHQFITPSNLKETILVDKKIQDNPDFLLFDDIIHVPKAQKEHNSLYDILHHFTDGNCFELTDLLKVVLKDDNIKNALIDECVALELAIYKNLIDKQALYCLSSSEIIDVLLSGYLNSEKIFFHPIPNLIFTRDIAVCIGGTILITCSKKNVRRRENILAKYIFKHYKPFSSLNVFDFHENFPNLSIEGGDIIIFDNKRICIGVSERTPLESISKIAPIVFNEGFDKIMFGELKPNGGILKIIDELKIDMNDLQISQSQKDKILKKLSSLENKLEI